ncbi:MAG: 1-deoxy-D-xylulose-5-phosphate synthase [Clostridiales bacterium]|nr:1-deoxy-D-xylulose-5-phosphate synthase [Clostridiales bacterium]
MAQLLDSIRLPDDVKKLAPGELKRLAGEIRAFLIDTVSKTGGHLASNLGVVELTIALYAVFDMPADKLVWDVGHQSYVHKILSGRKAQFPTLRQAGGLSGFPKRSESEYDSFNAGHSSTSVSAAVGFARARDLAGGKHRVIAITGDGALTGGMCYEALNDAGRSTNDIIVILNDNEMSISGNVGGVSRHLSRIRSKPAYFLLRDDIHTSLEKLPLIGRPSAELISKLKNLVKYALIPGIIFEELGFKYIGPVDGHDIGGLVKILRGVSKMKGPVLLHAVTKKGMGYASAESNPQAYHSVAPFEPESGGLAAAGAGAGAGFSGAFGSAMVRLAKKDKSIAAITAAMKSGVGLDLFAMRYPKRFFDVGIAEQHAATLAAGMALNGMKPVVAIYSTFLQRAYDQILHDVCLQNAHVVFAVDRAGAVGEDGETHQGLYDMAFLRHMPNMAIMAPSRVDELEPMLRFALHEAGGPVAIRYPRGGAAPAAAAARAGEAAMSDAEVAAPASGAAAPAGEAVAPPAGVATLAAGAAASLARALARPIAAADSPAPPDRGAQDGLSPEIAYGKGELVSVGGDVTIVAVGAALDAAAGAARLLREAGVGAELISARFVKPLDEDLIAGSVEKTGRLVVAEDGCVAGGFGSAVLECLSRRGAAFASRLCGFPDEPVPHGRRGDILAEYGLSAESICEQALSLLAADGAGPKRGARASGGGPRALGAPGAKNGLRAGASAVAGADGSAARAMDGSLALNAPRALAAPCAKNSPRALAAPSGSCAIGGSRAGAASAPFRPVRDLFGAGRRKMRGGGRA